MESSRSSMDLEQNFRDMISGGQSWGDYLGDVSGTAAEWAWSQGLDDWVANGGDAYDWYQDMLASFPGQKQALFDIYKGYLDKYGFAEGTPPSTMTRPERPTNGAPTNGAASSSMLWPTNEAAFIAVAVGLLAIAVYALKEK